MEFFPLIWIPLVPLLGAAVLGVLGNRLGRGNIHLIACGAIFIALAGSALAVGAASPAAPRFPRPSEWFHVGNVDVTWGFTVDRPQRDAAAGRHRNWFPDSPLQHWLHGPRPGPGALLRLPEPLFVSAMLVLVLADNLVLLFVGWGGRGPVLLSPDRVLVRGPREGAGRPQSLCRQPHR